MLIFVSIVWNADFCVNCLECVIFFYAWKELFHIHFLRQHEHEKREGVLDFSKLKNETLI